MESIMKFVFEKHNTDNGQYTPQQGIIINLTTHTTIQQDIIDTIIHESLHKAINEVGYSQHEVIWDNYSEGEEEVVSQLTSWSIENY